MTCSQSGRALFMWLLLPFSIIIYRCRKYVKDFFWLIFYGASLLLPARTDSIQILYLLLNCQRRQLLYVTNGKKATPFSKIQQASGTADRTAIADSSVMFYAHFLHAMHESAGNRVSTTCPHAFSVPGIAIRP